MRSISAFSVVLLASFPLGGGAGLSWQLGNGLAEVGMWRLVAVAVPTNLVVALLAYYLLRGSVHWAKGGLLLFFPLAAVSLFVSLGVAASMAGALGEGTASNVGAHTFSWGLSYACGQSFHDIRHGTWLGDD